MLTTFNSEYLVEYILSTLFKCMSLFRFGSTVSNRHKNAAFSQTLWFKSQLLYLNQIFESDLWWRSVGLNYSMASCIFEIPHMKFSLQRHICVWLNSHTIHLDFIIVNWWKSIMPLHHASESSSHPLFVCWKKMTSGEWLIRENRADSVTFDMLCGFLR